MKMNLTSKLFLLLIISNTIFAQNISSLQDSLLSLYNTSREKMYKNSYEELTKLLNPETNVDILQVQKALTILNYLEDKRCVPVLLQILERTEPIKIIPGTHVTNIGPLWGIKKHIKSILLNIADDKDIVEIKRSREKITNNLEKRDIDDILSAISKNTARSERNKLVNKLLNNRNNIKNELSSINKSKRRYHEIRSGSEKALQLLFKIIISSQDTETKILAVKVMYNIGMYQATPYYIRLICNDDKEVKLEAIRQMGLLGMDHDESIVPILKYIIDNETDKDIKDASLIEIENINNMLMMKL
jgi:HEAT repeat protein